MRAAGRLDRFSIGARLLSAALVCSAVILLISGLALSAIYRRITERAFDERLHIYLTELVGDLAAPLDSDRGSLGSIAEPRFEQPLSGWYWQITQLDNPKREVRASRSLVGSELPILTDLGVRASIGERREGYGTGIDDRRLRIVERRVDLGDEGRYLIAVAGDASEIDREIGDFNRAVAVTFLILGAALGLSTLVQVRFGLRPLSQLGASVAAVRRGEADHIAGRYPPDIAPLAGELNLMLDTNREIVERARTHVGNLAHALKTPLSVLANEAQGSRSQLAGQVRRQTEVMRDQVNYHLGRARAAALSTGLGAATLARPVVEGLARVFARLNTERGLTLAIDIPDDLRVRCEEQDLQEMLGNLIDNACKWTASEVRIAASLQGDPGLPYIVFTVDDDGPGLPEAKREEVLRRGRRLDESRPGSGLGLAIVVDLASLHTGSLTLGTSPAGGLRATLRLPGV